MYFHRISVLQSVQHHHVVQHLRNQRTGALLRAGTATAAIAAPMTRDHDGSRRDSKASLFQAAFVQTARFQRRTRAADACSVLEHHDPSAGRSPAPGWDTSTATQRPWLPGESRAAALLLRPAESFMYSPLFNILCKYQQLRQEAETKGIRQRTTKSSSQAARSVLRHARGTQQDGLRLPLLLTDAPADILKSLAARGRHRSRGSGVSPRWLPRSPGQSPRHRHGAAAWARPHLNAHGNNRGEIILLDSVLAV